jgi:spore coat protein U-like protein
MKMGTSIRLTALALLACLTGIPSAYAATTSTTFTVTATVATVCSVTATDLAFGAYANVVVAATSTVSVTCTSGGAYTVGLSDGANFSTTRRMKNAGTDYLGYELYKEVGHTNRWGNSGGELVSGTGSGAAQDLTVYGNLPGAQGLIAGSYTDTITVTVTY